MNLSKKEFLYYANQEEKDKWENYVVQNLCEMDKVFKHEGHEHGMGHWMVIDEDGIKAQKTLPSLITPSPNISSSKPNSKVSPTLPASFPPKADSPQQIISKVSPTLPLTFRENADYSQQVNFKVSPTLPAIFPPNADYPQLVNSKVGPTSPSNFPANSGYFQQVKYFQEKVEITRINRYNFANNNDLDCRITQSNIEAASMSFNFADVELFRKHKAHLNRQYIDTMNQYYHEEINYLLQLKILGALRNEDKHALHALSILAPNIYSSLCKSLPAQIPSLSSPISSCATKQVTQSEINQQVAQISKSYKKPVVPMTQSSSLTNTLTQSSGTEQEFLTSSRYKMPCYPMTQSSYPLNQMTKNKLSQQNYQSNDSPKEDDEPAKKRFKSENINTPKDCKVSKATD